MHKLFDISFLEKKQKEIDRLIKESFEDYTLDGITNLQKYIESPIKILWILKEVNDEGGYNQREAFNELAETVITTNSLNNTKRRNWWPTLDPIIYISYQILNDFKTWNEIDYIKEEPYMVEILQKIAYINIKKEPGGSTSIDSELSEGYEKAKEIIRLQIDLINPDIIIGGNTIKYLINDYNLKTFTKIDNYPIKYTINDNRLFIDSNHPQYLSRQNEDYKGEYFDTLVNIVKEWWNTKQHLPNRVDGR